MLVKASASATREGARKAKKVEKVKKTKKTKNVDKNVDGPVKGKTVGLTSGLQVHAFWGLLFGNQPKAKLSDEQLEAAVRKEFPLRDKVQPAARLRGWYNCGTYAATGLAPKGERGTNGKHPAERCCRYVDGAAVQRKPREKKAPAKKSKTSAKKLKVRRSKKAG